MSKKWSEFTQQTAFEQTDLLAIVRNSTNYTVPFSAAATALGVTGTINVVGGSGTPVLEQPSGTVNNIRTLEDGNGILMAVSALNGITISHNFTQDATGVEIVEDLATASPTFPSLLPGSGMQISRVDDVITFTATGAALPATKTVSVNAIGDFPTAVSGVITLEDDTVYVISNDVSTSDRFVLGNNTTITGWSVFGPLLEYTGTGVMFTGVDTEYVIINARLKATLGTMFNFSDTVPGTSKIGLNNINIEACDTIGTFTSLFSLAVNNVVCQSTTSEGSLFTGSGWQLISLRDYALITTSATLTAVDLGTSVSESIDIINPFIVAPSGAVAINGAANDANLTATGEGQIAGTNFIGAVTPLTGIVVANDVQWDSSNNQGIEETRPDSLSYNTAGTTVTISSSGVPVVVAGTWIDGNSSQFTVSGTGRVTYIGVKDLHVPIDISLTADPVSGSNKDFSVCVILNGTPVTASCVPARASTSDKISVSVPWQYTFSTNDYIEVGIQNDTDTTNFTVSHGILRIN